MNGDAFYKLPLSADELWDALTKGLGRALLHVRESGDPEGLLPRACREDLRYDIYEGLRASWLIELMEAADGQESCRIAVLAALPQLEDDGYANHDARQLCALAEYFARSGDAAARQALDEVFDRLGFGCEALIRLDGETGYRKVLRSLKRFKFAYESPIRVASEVLGPVQARVLLEEEARTNADAASMMEGERAWDASHQPQRRAAFEEVVEGVERGDFHINWAAGASETEIAQLYQRFLIEDRPQQLLCYLKIFSRTRMPALSDRLFESARSDDGKLRHAARMALGDWDLDPEERRLVRRLARELLDLEGLGKPGRSALPLLRKTFVPEDAPCLQSLLAHVEDRAAIDDVSMDCIAIAEGCWAPELVPLLLWVYQNSYCAWPRNTTAGLLLKHQALPESLREECRFDCLPETRVLVG